MLKKIIAMLLMSIMVLSGTVISFAENDNNAKRYMMAERTMSQDDVDSRVKMKLLNKIKSGKKLESEKSNSKPVSVKVYDEKNYTVKKEVFNDESYILTKITNIEPLVKANSNKESWTASIEDSGTIVSSTSYHTQVEGAKVFKSHGVYWVSFKFDYTAVRQGNSSIDYVYSKNSAAGGGTMSVSSPEIIKSTDSSGTPARAEMGFDFSGVSDVGSYSGVVGITLTRSGPNAY